MKIIDKNKGNGSRKDYYDYLTGIYGIDEKLVLDRRQYDLLPYSTEFYKFIIGGYIIEGIYNKKHGFVYGKDLEKFKIPKSNRLRRWLSKHYVRDYNKSITIQYEASYGKTEDWVYLEPVKDIEELNIEFNCPILLQFNRTYLKFPLLKDFGVNKFIPAETIYQWLSAWLGNQITLREQSPELSNDGKIEAKGFNNKTSFRPKMK